MLLKNAGKYVGSVGALKCLQTSFIIRILTVVPIMVSYSYAQD